MKLPLHQNMSNQELAEVLDFIAGVLDLQGANRFRIRAYDNAATVIAQHPKPIRQLFDEHYDLAELPGIGETLAAKLKELFTTGRIEAFDQYTADIPAGTFPLANVNGIGVKRAYKIAKHYGLDNAATALEKTVELAKTGQIQTLDGFGKKSEKDLITMIENNFQGDRMPYLEARAIADKLIAELKTCPAITNIEALGSLRRRSPTVGDIDLGIAVTDMEVVKTCVKEMKSVKRVVVSGDQLIRVILTNNQQVDIKVATPAEWGSFLQHFTGSKEHNIRLRELALRQNQSLSEHGITDTKTKKLQQVSDENEFYDLLGLHWIPPEDRTGNTEIERAKK